VVVALAFIALNTRPGDDPVPSAADRTPSTSTPAASTAGPPSVASSRGPVHPRVLDEPIGSERVSPPVIVRPARSTVPPSTVRSPAPATVPDSGRKPDLDGRDPEVRAVAELDVTGDSLLDLDHVQPVVVSLAGGSDLAGADSQVGPNNMYPHNGATNWYKDVSGTCADQRATRASWGELILHKKLEGRPNVPIEVCVVTNEGTILTLTISSARVDGGAPYHIRIAPGDVD
jgi:hypothetical protein